MGTGDTQENCRSLKKTSKKENFAKEDSKISNLSSEESYELNKSIEELGFIALNSTKNVTFSDKITIILKCAVEQVPNKHVTIDDFVTEIDNYGNEKRISTIIEESNRQEMVFFK